MEKWKGWKQKLHYGIYFNNYEVYIITNFNNYSKQTVKSTDE